MMFSGGIERGVKWVDFHLTKLRKKTVILPNFLVWKFCGKTLCPLIKFLH